MTGSAEVSNAEVREIWDRKAAFWDDYMKEGNWHSKELVWPAQERLLGLGRGESVLEVACGNGNFARRMARAGAKVVASDFSEVFIDLAKARTVEDADMIDYRVLDATDSGQLLALGEERFDAAVCTMALFDMAAIEPLAASPGQAVEAARSVRVLDHPPLFRIAQGGKGRRDSRKLAGRCPHDLLCQGDGLCHAVRRKGDRRAG